MYAVQSAVILSNASLVQTPFYSTEKQSKLNKARPPFSSAKQI